MASLLQDGTSKTALTDKLSKDASTNEQVLAGIAQQALQITTANATLRAEITSIQQQLAAFSSNILLSQRDLFEISTPELIKAHVILSQKHKVAVVRNQGLLAKIQRLQNKIIEKNAMDVKALKLEQAHAAQTTYLVSLKKQQTAASSLKSQCKRQERAIQQLEELIAFQSKSKPSLNSDSVVIESPAMTQLKLEIKGIRQIIDKIKNDDYVDDGSTTNNALSDEQLRSRIRDEETKLNRIKSELQSLKQKTATSPATGVVDLTQQVTQREQYAAELERQIMQQTQAFASESADIEMRLMEVEMQALGGFGSAYNMTLGDRGSTATSAIPPIKGKSFS